MTVQQALSGGQQPKADGANTKTTPLTVGERESLLKEVLALETGLAHTATVGDPLAATDILASVRRLLAQPDLSCPSDMCREDAPCVEYRELQAEVTRLSGEVERLREALSFYAHNYSWRSSTVYMCGHSGASNAEVDRGNKARQALSADPVVSLIGDGSSLQAQEPFAPGIEPDGSSQQGQGVIKSGPSDSPKVIEPVQLLTADMQGAEAEIRRLRAALAPFADLGVGSGPDDEPDAQPYRILRGAIRQARRALEQPK